LRQRYISLLLEIAGLHEEPGPAIEALTRVVAEQPAHEVAHAGLMRLYARSGRREAALDQYERLREGLRRGRAGEPGAASRRLRDEILSGRYPPSSTSDGRQARRAGDERRDNLPVRRKAGEGTEGAGELVAGEAKAITLYLQAHEERAPVRDVLVRREDVAVVQGDKRREG
jgi:DNA-binding SARP family transcriptional activator